jgi:hypothetical protein
VYDICGTKFGHPAAVAGGPFYVDLTAKNPPASVLAYAVGVPNDGNVIRISPDCNAGAKIDVAPLNSAQVTPFVKAKDGLSEAVRVAVQPGAPQATITVVRSGAPDLVLTLTNTAGSSASS